MSGLVSFIMAPVFRNIGLAPSWAQLLWRGPEIILIKELKKHIPVYVGAQMIPSNIPPV